MCHFNDLRHTHCQFIDKMKCDDKQELFCLHIVLRSIYVRLRTGKHIHVCLMCVFHLAWSAIRNQVVSVVNQTIIHLQQQQRAFYGTYQACKDRIFYIWRSVCYMFLSPPRPSVAKPSGSQLLRFGTLFHKISGYYHPLALSNAVSKLTSFPTPASHVPHLAICQRL